MKKIKKERYKTILTIIFEYFMMMAGSAIAAFSIEVFLSPNHILDGGIVGISMIIDSFTPKIPLSILTLALNVPFLIVAYKKIGRRFVLKSAFSMATFSIFLRLFTPLSKATDDYLLAVCFGGVLLGAGVGLVIRFGGCLDGTETVGIMLNRKFNIPVGKMVLVFNVVIYGVAAILFGLDRGMYSLLTYFITSKILDLIENGLDNAKAAMIITDDAEEISRKIYKKLGRTVTIMSGSGLVSGEKQIVYCVVTSFEVWELKHIINTVDASSFVTISDVSEIIGSHIKSNSAAEKTISENNEERKS